MKKIGVVSSFDVLCGNATYSNEIINGLNNLGSVDAVKIDVPMALQKNYEMVLVNEIVSQVKKCDGINIQMEMGLYGSNPNDAYRVLKKIITNAKSVSLTMHRIDVVGLGFYRALFNMVKKGSIRKILNLLLGTLVSHRLAKFYRNVINLNKNGSFIVHTQREKKRILRINPNANVRVSPILWPEENPKKLNLKKYYANDYPVLGLFGFISEYKNFEIAFEALKNEKVNILVAGGGHPGSPAYGKRSELKSPSYIRKISDLMMDLPGRCWFVTAPSDDELKQYMASVDVVCLPYIETGQSGSGVASLAINCNNKLIFSDNHCTTELQAFLNKKPVTFDADAPAGLLSALNMVLSDKDSRLFFKDHNFADMMKMYLTATIKQSEFQ
jgi:glycosyltransferase involved in cell wall biosynthesis